MSNNTQGLLDVAGVIALPDDSWVEGGFEATVISISAIPKKAGGEFYKVELGDVTGGETLTMSAFTRPAYKQGDRLRISGQGIKRKSYQGKPEVSVGKTTSIVVAAKGGPGAMQGTNPPPPANAVPGPTVGMAINNALTMLTQGLTHKELLVEVESPRFWGAVWHVASDIVRVGRMLEHGKLADSVAERSGRSATPAPKPQPAHDPEAELNEVDQPPF